MPAKPKFEKPDWADKMATRLADLRTPETRTREGCICILAAALRWVDWAARKREQVAILDYLSKQKGRDYAIAYQKVGEVVSDR